MAASHPVTSAAASSSIPIPIPQPFNPQSLYSNPTSSSSSSSSASIAIHSGINPSTQASASLKHAESNATDPNDSKKKQSKRRKVNLACIYCRRSHMTCDQGRPCQRCIKRDIGHLCHDEATGRASSSSSKKNDTAASTSSKPLMEQTPAVPAHHVSCSLPSSQPAVTISAPAMISTSSDGATSLFPPPLGIRPVSGLGTAASSDSPFISGGSGPYSSVSPMSNVNNDSGISTFNRPSASIFRDSVSPLKDHNTAFNNVQLGNISDANGISLANLSQNTNQGNVWSLAAGASLGGAGWLGLGGGPGGYEGGGSGFAGDSAGGNEFTLLSEFLESLDESLFGTGPSAPQKLGQPSASTSSSAPTAGGLDVQPSSAPTAVTSRPSLPPKSFSDESSTLLIKPPHSLQRSHNASVSESGPYPASLGGTSKTEKFFLTAADQNDGPRDERLRKVIQAKYEAGLLRPYNPVNGYARLNRWMERNVSQASKRRILKPLSVFRPAFRAVAQRLTNLDLVFIEEAFERLLLDYDRVFSTQGIPACLWRRTGEIYKGNKEFAELVGVPIESLREGRLCIYELMAEESAVNYWEKYGAVSFDAGQKAVLTSCVLRTKNKSMIPGFKEKMSAAIAVAAHMPRAQAASSGQITPTSSTAASFPPVKREVGKDKEDQTQVADESSENTEDGTINMSADEGGLTNSAISVETSGSIPGQTTTMTTAATPSTSSLASAATAGGNAATNNNAGKDSKVAYIHCCFSFTIRRDQWNIPTMIVGNFLPTNPP